MAENERKSWVYRALVTETLPYEVPVIFSNDKFYQTVSQDVQDKNLKKALEKLHPPITKYTVPYHYKIQKDSSRATELSIIHPLWQLEICRFYADHEGSLLSFCAKSEFSLRRPTALAALYVEKTEPDKETTPRAGIVELDVSEAELNPAHFISYFTYGKYNLLAKFFNSREFLRLEKKFRFMRSLDVSKCFYHIYTHSIAWKIKSKEFAKDNGNSHSFENRFDRLMQMANYNETNGIVVGPEISRIFAEIILQGADCEIQQDLLRKGLVEGRDYAIRRYVDDYSVFANSTERLDCIQSVVARRLGEVKLYLNEKKINTYERPFITPLTLARSELAECLRDLEDVLSKDGPFDANESRKLSAVLKAVRTVVARYGIELGNVSGWVMSSFRRLVSRANSRYLDQSEPKDVDKWLQFIQALLDVVFHVCAVDLRVRTTYNICQIISSVLRVKGKISDHQFEQVQYVIGSELASIVDQYDFESIADDPIELLNIVIAGAHFLGADFVGNPTVLKALSNLSKEPFTYFRYITLNFCYLTDVDRFEVEIKELSERAARVLTDGLDPRKFSDRYLLLCDYLGSPAATNKDKRAVFDGLFGGQIGSDTMDMLVKRVGFVDWSGFQIDHTLQRKELRPVYAMS